MLIIFVVTIFVLPKLCFFGVGLHPRLFRRHGPKEVAVRFCYRCVYSCIELVVCAFAFSSEVPCAWLRYVRAWFTLFSGVSSWKPQEQAEREIEEAKSEPLKFWGVLISKTWHVQLTGWVFLILLTWMWTECTTLWFGRVLFLALIAVLTWGRWVLFPAVVWAGCGGVKAELYPRVVDPLSDLLEDNGRVFDAQGTYDDSGNYKGRDTPAEGPNEAQLRRAADPDAAPLGAPPTRTRIPTRTRTRTPTPTPTLTLTLTQPQVRRRAMRRATRGRGCGLSSRRSRPTSRPAGCRRRSRAQSERAFARSLASAVSN